jgi:hypothetical protein
MTTGAPIGGRAAPELPRLGAEDFVPVPGSITFGEVLAALNPLHHLPVVGTLYRAATGETIQPALRVLGGAVTGGPAGALSAAVLAAIEAFRGGPPHAAG